MRRVFSLALVMGLAAVQSASAATVFYDFGDSNQQTPVNYNNIVVNPPGQLSIADSVDSDGSLTGITASASGFFTGSNTGGPQTPTGDAAIFAATATRDNAFGHAGVFGANPLTPQGTVVFGGLDGSGATAYEITIFAGRNSTPNLRETQYDISGLASTSLVLEPANNTSNVVTAAGVIPSLAGTITLIAKPGPNNNSPEQFYYLGAVRLVSSPAIPEPTSLVIAGLAGATLLFRRR